MELRLRRLPVRNACGFPGQGSLSLSEAAPHERGLADCCEDRLWRRCSYKMVSLSLHRQGAALPGDGGACGKAEPFPHGKAAEPHILALDRNRRVRGR